MSGYGGRGGGRGTGEDDRYGYGGGQGGGQQGWQRGQSSWDGQPQQRGGYGQRGQGEYRRTGGQPAQRGSGTRPRRAPGGYQGQYQSGGYQQPGGYGQGGYGGDWGNDGGDAFMPGFDQRDPRAREPRSGARRDSYRPGGPSGPGRPRDPRGRGEREDWGQYQGGKRRRGVLRRLAPWVALLVIVAPLAWGGLYVYHKYEARYHPADYAGAGTGQVVFQVKSGDNAFSVAPRLLAAGVIASDRAFTNAAQAAINSANSANGGTGGTTGLEVGFYQLHLHMKASLAWAALLNPKNRVQKEVTIPEGKRASQIALALAKASGLPVKQFQDLIAHPAQLGLPVYANGKAEGYLFPATYAILPHETALQILQAMVNRFKVEAAHINITAAAQSVHLTPAQLITEASLVQAEGGRTSDFPKIAEVIYNRLHHNPTMALKFDSSVLYGLGKFGTRASSVQIATPGPYNTYINTGLPPGPIANPGDAAIQGVLHRLTGDLLYFEANSKGITQFSATPFPDQM